MTHVEITAEQQYVIIGEFENILNELNADLPPLEGNGDLSVALNILQLSIAECALHLQRTFVLAEAIRGALYGDADKFVKSGEKFHGPTPIK